MQSGTNILFPACTAETVSEVHSKSVVVGTLPEIACRHLSLTYRDKRTLPLQYPRFLAGSQYDAIGRIVLDRERSWSSGLPGPKALDPNPMSKGTRYLLNFHACVSREAPFCSNQASSLRIAELRSNPTAESSYGIDAAPTSDLRLRLWELSIRLYSSQTYLLPIKFYFQKVQKRSQIKAESSQRWRLELRTSQQNLARLVG